MFKRSPNIKKLSSCFETSFGSVSDPFRIFSPSVSNGIVTSDDGLFSPLVNLEEMP